MTFRQFSAISQHLIDCSRAKAGPLASLALVFSILVFFLPASRSLAAPAISSALVEQAKRMSPGEREALARQYGIPLGSVVPPTTSVTSEQVVLRHYKDPGMPQIQRQRRQLVKLGEAISYFALEIGFLLSMDRCISRLIRLPRLKTTCLGLVIVCQLRCSVRSARGTR